MEKKIEAEVKQKLIAENKIEHLYFYKNGKQIARFEGESDYVNPSEQQLIRMKDCEVLHNHLEGSSFSVQDIAASLENARARIGQGLREVLAHASGKIVIDENLLDILLQEFFDNV